MINLELTEEQAKTVLIVMGHMTGPKGSRGVYDMVRTKLRVIGPVPEPLVIEQLGTIIVYDSMIESVKTM